MGEFDITAPSLLTGGMPGRETTPRLIEGGLQIDPSVPVSPQTAESADTPSLSFGLPAIAPPISPEEILSVLSGGEPPSEAEGRVEWGQASPPSSLKEALKVLGFSDPQIAKLTDEELEDGISLEELRRLDPDKAIITDMAYNLLSRGGLGVNALGGVAADEDGIQLADVNRFLTEVVAPLVSGTGRSLEVIARFLKANKFRVISRHAAARAFRESTKEKEGLWTTTDGTTTLSVKTLIDKYVRGELKGLAGKVLANILGHEVTEADRLTEDQLADFFLTMYFVAKSDSPENIMSEAKDIPELEGDSPAKLIAWLTQGAEQEVHAEEHATGAEAASAGGSSPESRTISGSIAVEMVLQAANPLTGGADPNFTKALRILNLAIDENKFMRPVQDESGIHEEEYTLVIDEEGRRELLSARETTITRMVIGEESVVKGMLGELLEKGDYDGALALLRSALAGSVEIDGQTITFEVTAELREKFAGKLADIAFQLARIRLLDQEEKPRADISTEDYNAAIKYLLAVQTLTVEYPGLVEESRIQTGQTLMAMAIFGLSKSGGALDPENLLSLEQLKAEIISGAQDAGFREYVKREALAEPAGRNPLSLDDAMLMRWKRVYVARIEALQRGEAYSYNTAIVPNMTDPSGNDGWFERRTPPPPAFGEEPAEEAAPAAHSSPRPSREHRETPTERATPPAPAGGRFAERVSQISDQRVRTAVSGWSEDKQKSFFQKVDNFRREHPDLSAGDAERQAFAQLS
ncbi:MAG: hypothetical protein WC645_00500 [Candidatus Margulisiibacteriota bacterium]